MVAYKVLIVSSSRSDLGYLQFVIKALQADSRFQPVVVATGSHLALSYGRTISEFEAHQIPVDETVEMLLNSDSPVGIVKSMGVELMGFSDLLQRRIPDAVLVMGDRYEILAAVLACIPFSIPVIHLSGGDITIGAMDDSIRHAITKLSHFHLPATKWHADHLRQLGEEDWRIRIVGEPILEFLRNSSLLKREELERRLNFKITSETLLVTYHPETMSLPDLPTHLAQLTQALKEMDMSCIFSGPNADMGSSHIREILQKLAQERPRSLYVENLGHLVYLSLFQYVGAVVGNSSSGLVEAPSFSLPAVNIGDRQKGRLRVANVIDVPAKKQLIQEAIAKALSQEWRQALEGIQNPYGDGHTSQYILQALSEWLPKHSAAYAKLFVERL